MWINIDSQSAIDKLLNDFGGFYDACLREVSIATETYIKPDFAMVCSDELDTSAFLFLQGGTQSLPAIEIKCERVTAIRIIPTPDNCDSILNGGKITKIGKAYRIALNFIGAPLTGPPNTSTFIPGRSYEAPDIEIVAKGIAWRPVENGLGKGLRYRRGES